MTKIVLMLFYSIFIVIVAGKLTAASRIFNEKKLGLLFQLALYYLIGSVTISLYMFALSLLSIPLTVLNISFPFLVYFFYRLIIDMPSIYEYSIDLLKNNIDPGKPTLHDVIWGLIVLLLVVMVLTIAINNLLLPGFRADAIGGWLLKAKIFFFEKRIALDILKEKIYCLALDYPLLVPIDLSWISLCMGFWKDTMTRVFFTAQYLCGIIVFYGVLRQKISRLWSAIAALIVFANPVMLVTMETAYADGVLSMFGFLCLYYLLEWMDNGTAQNILAAGFFAGACAWTKNDGTAFLIAALITMIVFIFFNRQNLKDKIIHVAYSIIIAMCIFMPFRILLIVQNIGNHMIQSPTNILINPLLNIGRIPVIARYFGFEFFLDNYSWQMFWLFMLIVLVLSRGMLRRSNLKYLLLAIAVVILTYAGIYLIVPGDYVYLIESSIVKLMLGILPTAGYIMFLAGMGNDEKD